MHGPTASLRRFDTGSLLAIAALACVLRLSAAAAQQSSASGPAAASPATPSPAATSPAANSPTATPGSPAAPVSAPREMPTPEQLEPGVNTSLPATAPSASPATPQGKPPGDKAGTAGARQPTAGSTPPKGSDRLQLEATEITGNRELPKVLYIVPWKRSDLGDLTGRPVNSLLDEVLQPLDRDVFQRENRYYNGLKPPVATSKGDASGGPGSQP